MRENKCAVSFYTGMEAVWRIPPLIWPNCRRVRHRFSEIAALTGELGSGT